MGETDTTRDCIDVHRTFGEVVIWDKGVLRHAGRIDMTRAALEGLGKSLRSTDEMVIEATGNSIAVSRVLTPFVARAIIANPLQGKAIAQAHVKTDKTMPARSPVCRLRGICRRFGRLTPSPNTSAG